jgi:alpha-tubulin suppressor-like RCC1 family protein
VRAAQLNNQTVSALDSGGNLWGWGYDNYGQIGNDTQAGIGGLGVSNDNQEENLPPGTPGTPAQNFVSATRCSLSAMALDVQGTLWGWGENANGEIFISTG